MRFSEALHAQQEAEHGRLRESARRSAGLPSMPPGFRAEDVLGSPGRDGFLPSFLAADEMGVTEAELVRQVRAGLLEARTDGATLYVRPAVVHVLEVRRKGEVP